MAEVTAANTAPAVAAPANQPAVPAPTPAPAASQETISVDEFNAAKNAAQQAMRLVREMKAEVDALKAKPAAQVTPATPTMPVGVEEELKALKRELEIQKETTAKKELDAAFTTEAMKLGVDPNRVKYLKYEITERHKDLTHEGVADPMNPSQRISLGTIIAGILQTPAGAMFKAAPTATSLPSANAAVIPAKKQMKAGDFNKLAQTNLAEYQVVFESVRNGEIELVD